MARLLTSHPSVYNQFQASISRQTPSPLERESLFFSLGTENDTGTDTAMGYAKNSGIAYVGQTIAVVESTSGNNITSVKLYQIKDTTGRLEEVGSEMVNISMTTDDFDDTIAGFEGLTAEDFNKAWSGSSIVRYIAGYVDKHGGSGGGGGGYTPQTISFTGLNSMDLIVGAMYSFTEFYVNVPNPNQISSDITVTATDITNPSQPLTYTTKILRANVASSNKITVNDLKRNNVTPFPYQSGQITNASYNFTFSVSTTGPNNDPITATKSFFIRGSYYMFVKNYSASAASGVVTQLSALNPQTDSNNVIVYKPGTYSVTLECTDGDYIWIGCPTGTSYSIASIVMNGFNSTDTFKNLTPVPVSVSYQSYSNMYTFNRSNEQGTNVITLEITIS